MYDPSRAEVREAHPAETGARMPLTLELPPNLSRLLAAEAEKAGISTQEHATK